MDKLKSLRPHLIILLFMAFLITASCIATISIVQTQDSAATNINVSGYQRMLSQRIALHTAEMRLADSKYLQQQTKEKILAHLEELQTNHNALIYGDAQRNIAAANRQNVISAYNLGSKQGADAMVREYIEIVTNFATMQSWDNNKSVQLHERISKMATGSLLRELNNIVVLNESNVRRQVRILTLIQLMFWITQIFTLGLVALWLFLPKNEENGASDGT